ncbi:hypothetical protein SAY87_012484 [Trapa incisa]|uniref:Uncharacterized protein n=1 Tax=Trapa incisa TaxID=236973 RepID=A0AAN7H159_9MYRT|nr:hypothetical protein SAY87_012484 [Trapa incisa]
MGKNGDIALFFVLSGKVPKYAGEMKKGMFGVMHYHISYINFSIAYKELYKEPVSCSRKRERRVMRELCRGRVLEVIFCVKGEIRMRSMGPFALVVGSLCKIRIPIFRSITRRGRRYLTRDPLG